MNKSQALLANQKQGQIAKELRATLGITEYTQRFVGDNKNHIRKIKGIFHNPKTGLRNYDQVDKTLQFLMNKPK
jgi:hypothetical protein